MFAPASGPELSTTPAHPAIRWLPAILAVVVLALALIHVLPIRRVPTPSADGSFYKSIALSLARQGSGIPSMFEHSQTRVDHRRFYGPVYFDLAAWSIRTFGISQVSTRLVSVAGVLLLAAAGGLAAVWLAGGLNRGLAAAGFLLIAPELNAGNVAATMHPVGVALEIVALAGVAAVARWPASWWPGLLAGSGLAGAALTTPRAYPCVLAFVLAGVLWRQWAPGLRRSWTVAVTLAGVAVVSWAIASGGLAGWVDLIWTVFSSEDRDVALLPTAARNWAPSGGMLVTAVAGVIGTLVAARALATPAGARLAEAPVLGFALLWMWITGVASLVSMSYVSASRIYWAVPVLAVALAVPYERLGRARVAAWLAAGRWWPTWA